MPNDFSQIPCSFDVQVYGDIKQVSSVRSSARLRIFYKGMNRNRTFISDDFANQLIKTLPYTPVKGIFDKETTDFLDHGEANSDGRIYGIVPENPNFQWEEHVDIDGITRKYACCDVFLFTGIYPEAKLIHDKPQSMELYRKTLKGEWLVSELDNMPYFNFESGEFCGLQVLGEEVEPCFEGAAFFSLLNRFEKQISELEQKSNIKESEKMDKQLFMLSNHAKAESLFDLCNPNFTEESNWTVDKIILDVTDVYVLTVDKTGKYQQTAYSVDNETVSLGETVDVNAMFVSGAEFDAIESLKAEGEGSFAKVVEDFATQKSQIEAFNAEKAEIEARMAEMQNATKQKSEVESESDAEAAVNNALQEATEKFEARIAELEAEKCELNKKVEDIINENSALSDFKANIERQEKQQIFDKYSEFLSDEQLEAFKSEMNTESVDTFKQHISVAVLENKGDALFGETTAEPPMIFKNLSNERDAESGALTLLKMNIKRG